MIYTVVSLMMLLYLMLWPVQLLHHSEMTVSYIKHPYLTILTISLFLVTIYKNIHISFVIIGFLLLLLAINYSVINGVIFSSYTYRAFLFVMLCVFFYSYPEFITHFIKVLLLVSALLSFLAILAAVLTYFDYPIYYENVSFVDSGGIERRFNLFFGFKVDPDYYRATSYFSEANKFAYFLTPSFFISYINKKKNYLYLSSFLLISGAIVLTFSFFTFLSITLVMLIYKYDNRKKRSLAVQGYRYLFMIVGWGVVSILIFYLYKLGPEYFSSLMDKTGSIRIRLLGMKEALEIITQNKFGVPKSFIYSGEGNTTLAIFYWLKYGGIQVLIPLIIVLYIWFRNCRVMMKSSSSLYSAFSYGLLAYLLQQSFYGDYFEYLFLCTMSILTSFYVGSIKSYNIKQNVFSKPRC